MQRLPAPVKPANFDAAVADAVAAAADAIARNKKPDFGKAPWKRFTSALAEAQHGKCGFCEARITNVADPDVEHYWPKSEVRHLGNDPKDWGEEQPHLPRLRGRRSTRISARGYWWRAYEWSNYLLACGVCNRKYKSALFPVLEDPRSVPPMPNVTETPLLLNPFFGPDPVEHLSFDALGGISARGGSRFGFETIKTCGLHRKQLMESRLEKAHEVHAFLDELEASLDARRQREILDRILYKGDVRFPHSGMVRTIFVQRTGISWADLEARLEANPALPPKARLHDGAGRASPEGLQTET